MGEVYKGVPITLTTRKAGEEGWTAWASLSPAGQATLRIEAAEQTYASEEEARQAALQAAIERIDRDRTSKGKW